MTTANVQLVVRDYRAGHVIRDQRKTVCAAAPGVCSIWPRLTRVTGVSEAESPLQVWPLLRPVE